MLAGRLDVTARQTFVGVFTCPRAPRMAAHLLRVYWTKDEPQE